MSLAVVSYVGLSLFAPRVSSPDDIKLNASQTILLVLSLILPYLITWVIAIYGLTVLGKYLASAPKQGEFVPFLHTLHCGLAWIIFGIIATALCGAAKPYFASADANNATFAILTNYLYIFPLLIGIWVLYKGAHVLRTSQKQGPELRHTDIPIKTLLVFILAASYTFLIFTNPNRQVALSATVPASYYLPDPLIILTIIIPVIITWWLGFSVAFTLSDLIPRVTDARLFKAMTKILYGIWSIIFTSILLQAVLSLGTSRLLSVGLAMILALVYLFVLLQGFGYLLLALGIRKLLGNAKNLSGKV